MKKETRIWLSLLLFGLVGQLAWTIENMYFNVFVYNTLNCDVDVIASMVSLSAITATVTTLVIGALSDKVRKRKVFICLGYLIWGITVVFFAYLNTENIAKYFPSVAAASFGGYLAIGMDCLMTFFGSGANDACFNAWITDTVDPCDRSKYESVIATLPLVSMIIVFGLLDPLTQKGNWYLFFMIVGVAVSAVGILGIFIIKDAKLPKTKQSFFENIVYGFKKEVTQNNKALYLSLLCLMVLCTSTQIFMPYMIIYIQSFLGISNYAIILAVVLFGASVISVVIGSVMDKAGNDVFYIPSIVILSVGLAVMYFVRKPLVLMIIGVVFMSGNLIVTTLVNGSIRNHTPKDKAGLFQGIRMIFSVMIPMIVGPFIGAAVIKNTGVTYTELGVVKTVPSPEIWLASAIVALLIVVPYIFLKKEELRLSKIHHHLSTVYGENFDEEKPLPQYPRPQMIRESYINLNGKWKYAINQDEQLPFQYDGDVIVPYPIESQLSKVEKYLTQKDILWYHRSFVLQEDFNKGLVYLHFGAVDQSCKVYINGSLVGSHEGGYLPFSFEISEYLNEGENGLTVMVKDVTDKSYYSRGKQSNKRGEIWYTPCSGIWQTVWLESTAIDHVENIKVDVNYDQQKIHLHIDGISETYHVQIEDFFDEYVERDCDIDIPDMQSWTPEQPYLYDLIVSTREDRVRSYFGMRKFSVGKDSKGIQRLMLNNQPYFQKGVLDQGYYCDGIYTPANYQIMWDDLMMLKEMGFNTVRKHIKIEPLVWYYYCDKIGLLVWQDMVNGGTQYSFMATRALPYVNIQLKDNLYGLFARKSKESRELFYKEMTETVKLLYNTVSLSLWVVFNEGWGQFDALKVTEYLRSLDNSRVIDHASGWHDQKGGDLLSKHIYFSDITFQPDDRVWALTEYGGYNRPVENHVFNDANYGYKLYESQVDLEAAFMMLHTQQIIPLIEKGLSATIYTQLSDVEDEVNGLITYDRKVVKFNKKTIKSIMDKMII